MSRCRRFLAPLRRHRLVRPWIPIRDAAVSGLPTATPSGLARHVVCQLATYKTVPGLPATSLARTFELAGNGKAQVNRTPGGVMAGADGYGDDADDLVWEAPRWVVPLGTTVAAILLLTCSLVFWLGMGTDLTDSVTEAFGVVFGVLVVVSGIGAFHRAAVESRTLRA
jgi:hypothetical protein